MDTESQEKYQTEGIDTLYLVKTDHSHYAEIADGYAGDGSYHRAEYLQKDRSQIQEIDIPGALDARRLVAGLEYQNACWRLWDPGRIRRRTLCSGWSWTGVSGQRWKGQKFFKSP